MGRWILVAVAGVLAISLISGSLRGPFAGAQALRVAPGPFARRDIPPDYLAWYRRAASTCPGEPWSVLAGIGKVESDHGRSHAPGVWSGANRAGAMGPMQFLPATFAAYGVDGNHDGRTDVYQPADAIYGAATLLCARGARGGSLAGVRRAVFAYNHASRYVNAILSWAARYAG